jgi:putative oxidoreductase
MKNYLNNKQGQIQVTAKSSEFKRSTFKQEERMVIPASGGARFFLLAGRIFYSVIFIMAAPGLISNKMTGYATSHGVPMASLLVPVAGILALLGGLSILFGYKARLGAWALIIFLVPVTLIMHNFWAMSDPTQAQMQLIHFMKNMSLLGGAFMIAYFGSGHLSLDKK